MYKTIIFSASLFFSISAFSQVQLTSVNNGIIPGDSVVYNEIQFVAPGPGGRNQVWDFSQIKLTEKTQISRYPLAPSNVLEGNVNFNQLNNEKDNEYYLKATENFVEEVALTRNDISIIYLDPLIRMKYPFTYGDSYTDAFSGIGTRQQQKRLEFKGVYTITADASGTLILPDRILKNTTRLKIEKTGTETRTCSNVVSDVIRYVWYAPGYRYPVLSIYARTYQISQQEPVHEEIALLGLQQPGHNTAVVKTIGEESGNDDYSLVVYPNPFNKTLSFNYFLKKEIPVSIDIYDVYDKSVAHLMDRQVTAAGLHSGELDATAYSLTPGIYFIRFTFNNKVVVSKVVKL